MLFKVQIGTIGSCHRYGMVGTDTIVKGETIIEIPRPLVLSPENCSIAQLLKGSELETSSKEQRCRAKIRNNKNVKYYFRCYFENLGTGNNIPLILQMITQEILQLLLIE